MIRKRQIVAVLWLLALCGSAWASAPNQGLIAHWKFDEGEGNIAYDSVGNNHGTVYGATWTTGQIEGALGFDGINDYVGISNDKAFNFGSDTDFSVSAWVKTTTTTHIRVVDKQKSGHSPYEGFLLQINNGTAAFRTYDNSGNRAEAWATTNIADGKWHFITAVADRNGNAEIYTDGNREDFDPMSTVGNINNDIALAIGRSMDYDGQYFDGKIDDVRIYDRALSAEEIEELYQEGSDLVAHWKFDEGNGTTAYDSVGDNHGTLVNGPTWTTGQIDGALSFDGVDDWINAGTDIFSEATFENSGGTLSAWVYPTSTLANRDYVIGIEGRFNIGESATSTNYWKAAIYDGDSQAVKSTSAINVNEWAYLAATWDTTTLKFYVDGVYQGSVAQGTPLIDAVSRPVTIGAYWGNSGRLYFTIPAIIDDVRIYNRALSAEEVQELYWEGIGEPADLEYHIIDLGTLGGSESKAYGINEYGQIVGSAETSLGETHAFIYEGGVMSDLGTLSGNMSEAWGINENGQIVGRSVNEAGKTHGFLYEDGVMYDLGTLGGNESYCRAINNNGQIACSSQISTGYWRAAIYENGQMRKLRTFSSSSWNALSSGINSSGQIVGYSDVVGGTPWHACLWEGDTITDLGTLPGTSKSFARGINDNGQITGYSNNYPSLPCSGFICERGVMSGIGSLGQSPDDTRPRSINNIGQIVGYSTTATGDMHAFVYEDEIITDLGTLGGNSSEAWGINDAGMIVGWAETAEGDIHAVLWTPSLADIAIIRIKHAIDEKQEALERIDAALEKERAAYDALKELLKSRDYGDLNRRDIFKAMWKIRFAIRYEKWSRNVLERSIEKLGDSLSALGYEAETNEAND